LKINKNVALVVWHKDWENVCVGVELRGIAEEQKTGKWFDLIKKLPENQGYNIKSAIVVKVKKVKKLLS
jgi:hypothetical protein